MDLEQRPEDTPDERYGWYVVFILILAYTISYVDRQILTLMVEPIKASLHISDVQVSLLHGLAFAVFYTLLGVPIARLADRYRRVTIITAGVFVWSAMTALCGVTRSFGQLFAARVGVGVGEAALSPAAYSMLADYFGKKNLPKAMSVYTGAIYLGAGLALIAGGALIGLVPAVEMPLVGHMEPWQTVFLLVAAPGLVVGLLVATLREPPRRGMGTTKADFPSLGELAAYMNARRTTYALLIFGYAAGGLMWNGATAWIATFFIRNFGYTAAQIGLIFGIILLTIGTASITVGGLIASRWRAAGRTDANLLVGILSAAIALPFGIAAPLVASPALSLVLFAAFVFGGAMPYGCAAAAFQEITPNRMRAQVSSIYFLGLNLAGIGLGPTVVALFTEKLFQDPKAVGLALALTIGIASLVSMLLLWLARKSYRATLEAMDA
ncbi:spinster family MFS transporter [Novosphingobium sp. BL-52-GroH]|uniref:spinster family MFS transporter n=1 Tax=Novosphingobium sp. BL-52-GroH TaxID=3349877 RepID=UPI00384D3954